MTHFQKQFLIFNVIMLVWLALVIIDWRSKPMDLKEYSICFSKYGYELEDEFKKCNNDNDCRLKVTNKMCR